jgi:hypothetical protein
VGTEHLVFPELSICELKKLVKENKITIYSLRLNLHMGFGKDNTPVVAKENIAPVYKKVFELVDINKKLIELIKEKEKEHD